MTEVNDSNPLSRFQTYDVKHIVVGFRFSEDACTLNIGADIGKIGTIIDGDKMKETNCKRSGYRYNQRTPRPYVCSIRSRNLLELLFT